MVRNWIVNLSESPDNAKGSASQEKAEARGAKRKMRKSMDAEPFGIASAERGPLVETLADAA
jgi:hypothetical protein